MDVLSSRILLRPSDLDRSRRFYRDAGRGRGDGRAPPPEGGPRLARRTLRRAEPALSVYS